MSEFTYVKPGKSSPEGLGTKETAGGKRVHW